MYVWSHEKQPTDWLMPIFFFCPTEHRCIESAKIRNKYPDRVPVSDDDVTSSLFAFTTCQCVVPLTSVCLSDLLGDCGESLWITDRGHRQEEVPGPLRHHSGSVHVDHQETHPAALREGHLPVCGQDRASIQVCATPNDIRHVIDVLTFTFSHN